MGRSRKYGRRVPFADMDDGVMYSSVPKFTSFGLNDVAFIVVENSISRTSGQAFDATSGVIPQATSLRRTCQRILNTGMPFVHPRTVLQLGNHSHPSQFLYRSRMLIMPHGLRGQPSQRRLAPGDPLRQRVLYAGP